MGKRAAVLIGVKKSGSLPELQATSAGVRLMNRWAKTQGFDPVVTITDDQGIVYARQVKTEIRRIIEPGDVEQLLVYFSGHGVNQGYREFWLLSEAIGDTNEAVNVAGSEYLARYGLVPHVIFVSDACRTAAEGIRAGALTGSEIFPAPNGGGRIRAVDLFYAATLGRPAHEVKDPTISSGRYRALYTEVLEECLSGSYPALLETREEHGVRFQVVRPRPLRDHLPARVLARLQALSLDLKIAQEPDALVNSGPEAWLARIELSPRGRGGGDQGVSSGPGPAAPWRTLASASPLGAARVTLGRALHTALVATPGDMEQDLMSALAGEEADDSFAEAVVRGARPVGPEHFETGCGFKLRGSRVVNAYAAHSGVELLSDDLVRVEPRDGADNIWLGFDGGRATVIPAIPDFVGTIAFDEGELVGVAYEPSDRSRRWEEYKTRRRELSVLRSLVAESTRFGVFRLEGNDALNLADRIKIAKGLDPTLAVYAAYAYHDLHREDLISDMKEYLQVDLGFLPYDIALLAGDLRGLPPGGSEEVRPFFPLLAQGWALLRVLGGRLPAKLEGLQRHLMPSLWSLFDERGAEMILDFMKGQR